MRGAHPERDLERAIVQSGVLNPGERVLAACSGGPDSVALTAALAAVAKGLGVEIRAAHVNHGVRASAWQDECVALELGVRCLIPMKILALEPGADTEERLRAARYDALVAAARRNGCNVIATAHHARDQSETVMLALLRGTGPAGLRGIAARRPLAEGIELARPLIRAEPSVLLAYCHARALPYAIDPTNADLGRRRNAVRSALEALRPLFPGLDVAVARAAELAAEERKGSRRAELRRGVRARLAEDSSLQDLDFEHVEAAVRALESGRSGTFAMKPGAFLRIERGSMKGITVE